ncbi:hypothetical protein [Microbulbifer sp. ANSA005]|uniref:hypothetical protein n=1 Tax=Microbulbifer sp. ANSA005 TaxID=3243362 RepID=UPI0040434993
MGAPNEFLIGGPDFWAEMNKSKNLSGYTFCKDGGIHYVIFDDTVKMEPFVRSEEIMFDVLARSMARDKDYLAIINAQFYDLTPQGYADYAIGNDAVTPKGIEVEGYTVFGKEIIAGRPAPKNFHIANHSSHPKKYTFGFGQAPTNADAAIGGAGPIIINGLPYGPTNLYKKGAPKGKLVGQPSKENAPNLIRRSNATFKAFSNHKSAPKTGMTVVAHHSTHKKLGLFVKPDGRSNTTLEKMKNKLVSCGFDNAIFLDGSNSSMLMVGGEFYARQGVSKNKTNVVGIGFKY